MASQLVERVLAKVVKEEQMRASLTPHGEGEEEKVPHSARGGGGGEGIYLTQHGEGEEEKVPPTAWGGGGGGGGEGTSHSTGRGGEGTSHSMGRGGGEGGRYLT